MAALTFTLGQRVADKDGCRGTIRYIGPVATSKSADTVYAGACLQWTGCVEPRRLPCVPIPTPPQTRPQSVTGIEWDDATRGKSDGSVTTAAGEVVRYFTYVA